MSAITRMYANNPPTLRRVEQGQDRRTDKILHHRKNDHYLPIVREVGAVRITSNAFREVDCVELDFGENEGSIHHRVRRRSAFMAEREDRLDICYHFE